MTIMMKTKKKLKRKAKKVRKKLKSKAEMMRKKSSDFYYQIIYNNFLYARFIKKNYLILIIY